MVTVRLFQFIKPRIFSKFCTHNSYNAFLESIALCKENGCKNEINKDESHVAFKLSQYKINYNSRKKYQSAI